MLEHFVAIWSHVCVMLEPSWCQELDWAQALPFLVLVSVQPLEELLGVALYLEILRGIADFFGW
eukprot:1877686-Karenia_brevis.AAC.1